MIQAFDHEPHEPHERPGQSGHSRAGTAIARGNTKFTKDTKNTKAALRAPGDHEVISLRLSARRRRALVSFVRFVLNPKDGAACDNLSGQPVR